MSTIVFMGLSGGLPARIIHDALRREHPTAMGEAVTDLHPSSAGRAIRSTVCFTVSTDTETEFSAGRARETGSFSKERVTRDVRRE
jgi:hypothetical protein